MLESWNMTQKNRSVPLSDQVLQALEEYFVHLGDCKPAKLYDLVIAEVEKPEFDAQNIADQIHTRLAGHIHIAQHQRKGLFV